MRRAPPEWRASRGPAQSQTSSTRSVDSPARRSRKERRADTEGPVPIAHESFGRTECFSKQWQELRTRANQNCPWSSDSDARTMNRRTIRECAREQSQRDCVLQPKVARNELPWVTKQTNRTTSTRLWPSALTVRKRNGRNRVAVDNVCWTMTQGSSFLATLGFRTESRWES